MWILLKKLALDLAQNKILENYYAVKLKRRDSANMQVCNNNYWERQKLNNHNSYAEEKKHIMQKIINNPIKIEMSNGLKIRT
jgi:hypothetical protein